MEKVVDPKVESMSAVLEPLSDKNIVAPNLVALQFDVSDFFTPDRYVERIRTETKRGNC